MPTVRRKPADLAGAELGRELRRIRKDVLKLTGPDMAHWLGIAARDGNGKELSTGKSLISYFERGVRVPPRETIEQYGRAPGVDRAAVSALWERAAQPPSRDGVQREGAQSGDADQNNGRGEPPDRPPSSRRSWQPSWRRPAVVTGGALLAVAIVLVLVLRRDSSSTGPQRPVPGVRFVFDALGTASDQTIFVYLGPGTSSHDHKTDLSYHSGASATVVCETRGRLIASHPTEGERPKATNVWVRIRTSSGAYRYATLTYGRLSPASAKIPVCR